ncbi:1241_t:CDS:2 [Paraglomus occultum]|uniref:RNA methyltransferase n=1 Tax=Paraglomus occultum TaxID=144539 RepID=A0A9N8VMU7_9GLOM|nr:1241_t:CDS:2 [Paraglomus occultum]
MESSISKATIERKRARKALQHRKPYFCGNYRGYYNKRKNPATNDDSRLALFKRDWFEERNILDIGCNSGDLTIAIARKFRPKTTLGIDIDSVLIRKANEGIKQDAETKDFENIKFETEDWMAETVVGQKFDTICLFSVSKWIHLYHGDEGIKRCFRKIYESLNDNGIFLFEPQEYKSYKKYKKISEITLENYNNIKFRPEHFHKYLMDELGFRIFQKLGRSESSTEGKNICVPNESDMCVRASGK